MGVAVGQDTESMDAQTQNLSLLLSSTVKPLRHFLQVLVTETPTGKQFSKEMENHSDLHRPCHSEKLSKQKLLRRLAQGSSWHPPVQAQVEREPWGSGRSWGAQL